MANLIQHFLSKMPAGKPPAPRTEKREGTSDRPKNPAGAATPRSSVTDPYRPKTYSDPAQMYRESRERQDLRGRVLTGDKEAAQEYYQGKKKDDGSAEREAKRKRVKSNRALVNNDAPEWMARYGVAPTTNFVEMSYEDYSALDSAQRAAVDFNGALATSLGVDKAGNTFGRSMSEAARSGDYSKVAAPMTKALMEDLQLSGPGTSLKDFLTGQVSIGSDSLENLSSVEPRKTSLEALGVKEGHVPKELRNIDGLKKLFPALIEDSKVDPADRDAIALRRDAELTDMIRNRMTDIFKENRLAGGSSLELDEKQEKIFDDLYNIVTGFQTDGSGNPILGRDGTPKTLEINPGDVSETLEEEGLGGANQKFYDYVNIRLREELNDKTEGMRKQYLSLKSKDILGLVAGG